MSYQVLARKWRPHHFKDVVGQPHVLTALENALDHNRLHHAYLFSGTRGVGKTTIARLFAKGLNCETGITSTPCGECSTCKEIDDGRFVDLLEIDAASRTKVEDTRELLDNVQYKPARGRFKVYLIDEVHMLSRHSFNALLKTLEEPPEYVKFLLATTDPQKLPVTILSRCLQFHLKHISVEQIHEQLDFILEKEEIKKEARAIGLISHAADGSMRDALSLTDQAIALGNNSVSNEIVSAMLGTLDTDQAIRILEALSTKDMQTLMNCINELADMGIAWDSLAKEIATQLHRLAMHQVLPATLDMSQMDAERIQLLSSQLSPQDVQLFYQIALQSREDLPYAPSAKIGTEMMLLRMMAFRPVNVQVIEAEPIQTPVTQSSKGASIKTPMTNSNQATPVPVNQPTSSPTVNDPAISSIPVYSQQDLSSQIETERDAHQHHQSNVPTQKPISTPIYDVPPNDMMATNTAHTTHREPSVDAKKEPNASHSADSISNSTEKNALLGVRNQLRSAKNNLVNGNMINSTRGGVDVKKDEATSDNKKTSSVFERIAEKQHLAPRTPVSHIENITSQQKKEQEEAYRWKATQSETKTEVSNGMTPVKLKQALEHDKTAEMVEQLIHESSQQDPWSALAMSLTLPKLTQQLVLNAGFKREGEQVFLCLRPEQQHLNSDKAHELITQALCSALGEEIALNIIINEEGTTPLELRESLYQIKLQTAFQSLQQDPHVTFFEQRFGAQIDKESVRPI